MVCGGEDGTKNGSKKRPQGGVSAWQEEKTGTTGYPTLPHHIRNCDTLFVPPEPFDTGIDHLAVTSSYFFSSGWTILSYVQPVLGSL